jgi:hypothetical protein
MVTDQKVISIQERLKDQAFEEIEELFYFANEYFGEYLLHLVDDFIETEQIPEKIASSLIPHFISWAVFCHHLPDTKKTILEQYLNSPEYKSRRNPRIHRIISEWKYASLGFYIINEFYGDRLLVVHDVLRMKERLVAIYNEIYHHPGDHDLLLGYLLPAGDGTYSPIIDFFHIPVHQKKEAVHRIIDFYNKKADASDLEFYVHHYPKLLSIVSGALQQ